MVTTVHPPVCLHPGWEPSRFLVDQKQACRPPPFQWERTLLTLPSLQEWLNATFSARESCRTRPPPPRPDQLQSPHMTPTSFPHHTYNTGDGVRILLALIAAHPSLTQMRKPQLFQPRWCCPTYTALLWELNTAVKIVLMNASVILNSWCLI